MKQSHSWSDVYEYFEMKGLYVYIANNIASLIVGSIISMSPIIVFGCIDYSQLNKSHKIQEIILPYSVGWKNVGFFIQVCSTLFFLFTFAQFTGFLLSFPKYLSIRRYFIDILKINDDELFIIDWNDVFERNSRYEPRKDISLLGVAQQILRFDNYMTAIISDPFLLTWKLPSSNSAHHFPMSRFFFYLFRTSLSGLVIDKSGCSVVNGAQSIRVPQLNDALRTRFRIIGFILLLISPFVFAFEVLYLFFSYFQAIKSTPDSISYRRWTLQAEWCFREYNELPHIFRKRLSNSYYSASIYMNQFPSTVIQPIAKTLSFLFGSIIAYVIIMGVFTDISLVFSIKIFGDKTISWLVMVCASAYAATKSVLADEIREFDPDQALSNVEQFIHYDFKDDRNSAHSWQTQQRFSSFFQPIWEQLIMEVASVIYNPYIFLIVLPDKSAEIIEFIRKNSIQHSCLGWICTFSTFEQNDSINDYEKPSMNQLKIQRSMQSFRLESPIATSQIIGFDNNDLVKSMIQEGILTPKAPTVNFDSDLYQPSSTLEDLSLVSPFEFSEIN